MVRTSKKRVAVIGLGFVGLTTALGFAQKGFTVFGFDVDTRRIGQIKAGQLPFHEPHLDEALARHLGRRFRLCASLADAAQQADVIFYCVGTPARASGGADLTFLVRAMESTLAMIKNDGFKTLVVKSTVPPGSIKTHIQPLLKKAALVIGKNIGLANNPEFLREGVAWKDFMQPDRIVIGTGDTRSFKSVAALYKNFGAEIFRVTPSTAEFIKSCSNALLATLVSFANETSIIADRVGDIDVKQAFQILHRDRRWTGQPAKMSSYAFPGCGFGGYCLPKDIAALQQTARAAGCKPELLRSVIAANRAIKEHFADKIVAATNQRTRIGVLGLSFKPGSDDVRDSPAAEIIKLLLRRGRKRITAYDPMANDSFKKLYQPPIRFAQGMKKLAAQADVFVLLTAWPEFRQKKNLLRDKLLFDGRYFL